MTFSTRIEVFTVFTLVRSGPSYMHYTVARSLCVSWAFLFLLSLFGEQKLYIKTVSQPTNTVEYTHTARRINLSADASEDVEPKIINASRKFNAMINNIRSLISEAQIAGYGKRNIW